MMVETKPMRLNISGVERPHELMSLLKEMKRLVMSTVLPWTLTACSGRVVAHIGLPVIRF